MLTHSCRRLAASLGRLLPVANDLSSYIIDLLGNGYVHGGDHGEAMASRINIYSQLLISAIRIVDITNSN
jgi:hypothetical protein